MEHITPHSHRFDFQCLVLQGNVENTIWTPTQNPHGDSDPYIGSTIEAEEGGLGKYTVARHADPSRWCRTRNVYVEGQWYHMEHDDIHSIKFSKGAKVLFFEGPQITSRTMILEPFVNGERVPTFKVEPWMFKKD